VISRHLPRSCFVGDPQLRAAAYRAYEVHQWADAVELRGLRLSSLEPVDRMLIEAEVRRRNASR
jgi:hypothetical protein